jgi:hypothetical protein
MTGELRVTLVATGLGRQSSAIGRNSLGKNAEQRQIEIEGSTTKFAGAEGKFRSNAKRGVESQEPPMDYPFLDIPAFLRRRAPIEGAECD